MPKKASHRMASRQAELSKKKKKGKPNIPNVHIPSVGATPRPQDTQIVENERTEDSSPVAVTTQVPSQTSRHKATTKRERIAASSLNVHYYVWPEIKRIGVLTAIMLAILIGLTFVLR